MESVTAKRGTAIDGTYRANLLSIRGSSLETLTINSLAERREVGSGLAGEGVYSTELPTLEKFNTSWERDLAISISSFR